MPVPETDCQDVSLPDPVEEPRRRCALLVDVEHDASRAAAPERNEAVARLCAALAEILPAGWEVRLVSGHDRMFIAGTVDAIIASGFEELIVVPLLPQYSSATGDMVSCLYRELAEAGSHLNVATRTVWYDDIGYVNAHARFIADYAAEHELTPERCHLLFLATPMPGELSDRGDLFEEQTQWTIELISRRLGWPEDRYSVVYQSPGGNGGESTGSGLAEQLRILSEAGEERLLISSLSPMSVPEVTAPTGHLEVFPGGELGLAESFLTALKNVVMRGPQRVVVPDLEPILDPGADADHEGAGDEDVDALVMIGVSTARRSRPTRGPVLNHCTPEAFGSVKKHRKAILECLDMVRQKGFAEEAFVWNTCQRVEFYGWLNSSPDSDARIREMQEVESLFFGAEGDGAVVNHFAGADAWHHLMRTAAGLNSDLPGDTDVLAQLQTACRIAGHSDMKGPRAEALMERAASLTEEVRENTPWGRYATSYCGAALAGVAHETAGRLDVGTHVVIGGSTTSHSILRALADDYSVFGQRKTVVYRCHHGQMKILRAALGDGQRLRVHSYSEESVLQAISEADYVYFGIDHPDPVLDTGLLADRRDYRDRPLTILDFNSFGSLTSTDMPVGVTLWSAQDLDRVVTARVADMARSREFLRAVEEAGEWIEQRVPAEEA